MALNLFSTTLGAARLGLLTVTRSAQLALGQRLSRPQLQAAARAREARRRTVARLRAWRDDPWGGPALARALIIGGAGGFLAHLAHVPLAFMLGALFACIGASLIGSRVRVSMDVRAVFLVLIGVFLGESFTSDSLAGMAAWPASLALAILYVPVAAWCCYLLYTRIARIAPTTALFSSIPGGLAAAVAIAESAGADEREVALSQSLRIAIVVVTAPMIAFGLLGYAPPDLAAEVTPTITAAEAPWLLGCVALGYELLRRLGAPMPFMVGPIIGSAAARLAGFVEGELPFWLVEAALVVTGASIGSRFQGADPFLLARLAVWTLAGTAVLLTVSAVFGLIAATLVPSVDLTSALLAFAPGGVAEMCLIALALDSDPGFVAAHHIVRIMAVIIALPLIAAWARAYLSAGGR